MTNILHLFQPLFTLWCKKPVYLTIADFPTQAKYLWVMQGSRIEVVVVLLGPTELAYYTQHINDVLRKFFYDILVPDVINN